MLMRLVFILYAEDRDLLPSRTDGRARALYENGYSVRGLYAKLVEDAALNPDTMDERRGGWGRLLALFRLIHGGHPHAVSSRRAAASCSIRTRFPSSKGARRTDERARVARRLRRLRAAHPRRADDPASCAAGMRERLSYRTLDVEQIGSVYETVMGFTVERAPAAACSPSRPARTTARRSSSISTSSLAKKGKDRIKYLKEKPARSARRRQAKAVEGGEARSTSSPRRSIAIVDERGSPRTRSRRRARRSCSRPTSAGAPAATTRRAALTAPIVRHALEPAFERLGPDATPEEVLDLKVCDPAMGSGAFLVEACRQLGGAAGRGLGAHARTKPVIPPDEDEELHARRLVAQRCLYGVDKNPLRRRPRQAVALARDAGARP